MYKKNIYHRINKLFTLHPWLPVFGLDTTDMTSTTTRSLDLSSLLDARSDSEASRSNGGAGTGDARAIRRQLRGLENMYAEVLQLLGVRRPPSLQNHPWDARYTLTLKIMKHPISKMVIVSGNIRREKCGSKDCTAASLELVTSTE